MKERNIRILLVEDNDQDARRIMDCMESAKHTRFHVSRSQWLNDAITAAKSAHFDAVLLDLSLHDSLGIDTLVEFMKHAPGLPIIVTTEINDIETAMRCVEYGAQDYIVKSEVTSWMIERAVLYAIERKRSDVIAKQLMRESIAGITGEDIAKLGVSAVLQKHANVISEALEKILDYLRKNAPGHAENVERIVRDMNVRYALRELLSSSEMEDTGQIIHDVFEEETRPMRRAPSQTIDEQASRAVLSPSTKVENPDEELLHSLKRIRHLASS